MEGREEVNKQEKMGHCLDYLAFGVFEPLACVLLEQQTTILLCDEVG